MCFDEDKYTLSSSCALSKDEKKLNIQIYGNKTCVTSINFKIFLDLRKLIISLRYKLQFNHVFYHSVQKHHNHFTLMHKTHFDKLCFCIIILLKVFFIFISGVTGYTIGLTGYQNETLRIFQKCIRCNRLTKTCNRLHLLIFLIFMTCFSCNRLQLCVKQLSLKQWHFLEKIYMIPTNFKMHLPIMALFHEIMLLQKGIMQV